MAEDCAHDSTQLILGDNPVERCLLCGLAWKDTDG